MPKYLVLQLPRKFLRVNFRFLQETAKDYLCQKLKTWSNLFGWKTEIIHGREQVSFRYGFF